MVRRTKEEAQETRKAILAAALQVFYAKGVTKASLGEISEWAGVTRGAIYWHFKNKVDLFEALHATLHQPFMEMIIQDLETDHPEPLKQLEELCVHVLAELSENETKQKLLSVFILKCEYSGDMEVVLQKQAEQKAKSRKLFDKYFERAKAKGHVNSTFASKSLSTGLWCYLSGIVQEFLRDSDAFNLKQQAVPLMRQYFQGLHAQ